MERPITQHDIILCGAGYNGNLKKFQYKDRRNGNVLREFETTLQDMQQKASEVWDELFISLFS